MKKWRHGFKKIILLSLITAFLGGCAANCIILPAYAKSSGSGGNNTGQGRMGAVAYSAVGEEQLGEDEKKIYDELKFAASQIASGDRTSSVVGVGNFTSLWDSEEDINEMMRRILSYLLMDCPYDFYWYDKDKGCNYTWNAESDGGRVLYITISMTVSEDYKGASEYMADREKTKAASGVSAVARSIVASHQNESDYEKLKSYMTEICNRVSYDWDTYNAKNNTIPYGNPWQLIPVFDGNRNTNAVCEGYAKAFQYLCDLSTFQDARCYTVEGKMFGGTGEGGHMWNIVTLEGSNYLVDVTNCDDDAVGAPDELFLAGTPGSIGDGYTFSVNDGNYNITYQYGRYQYGLLGDVLELASYSYESPEDLKLTVTPPTAEVTFGEPVDYRALVGGKAINGRGDEISGIFSWADDVTFYGNAGTNTLNAIFTPDDSRYEQVENIQVSVKVNPRPVTIKAQEQSKIYGQTDPEFIYTYENVIEGYPLSGSLTRTSGENVGTYSILQGDLTDENNPNYAITFTGNNFVIKPASDRNIEFVAGNGKVSPGNGITIRENASYGDLWSDIVKIGTITARTAAGSDSDPGHFTLQESGAPAVGAGQSFHVLYNGTIGGQTYKNEVVCEGTVDVKRRVLGVSAGSYKISKPYDKTRAGGTASGQLALNNLLAADVNRVSITAEPTGYTDANVKGQGKMTVNLSLSGAAANNYELGNRTVEVPCEITPKVITPTVKVSGSYSYTGRAITPTVTVSDGTDVLASSDYDMVLSNNKDTGTAKVSIRPKNGSNYTWSPAVETSFTIEKADYKGTKTASTSMEYGGTAVFSLYSMVPEGYRLGEIHVEDKEQIFAETPSVSGTVLSCKLVNDRNKEGKSATITLPVAESKNYRAYNLTFTVTMAAQRSDTNNQTPTYSGNGNGTGQPSAPSSQPTTEIGDNQFPTSGEKREEEEEDIPSGSVTAVDRENSKSGRKGGIGIAPIIGGVIGITLAAGIVGGIYFIRRRRKLK